MMNHSGGVIYTSRASHRAWFLVYYGAQIAVRLLFKVSALALMTAMAALGAPGEASVQIRFVDSATGYAIRPETSTHSPQPRCG